MAFNLTMTLGPASADPAIALELGKLASRFRLNASHLPGAQLSVWLGRIAETFSDLGHTLPVVVDLLGAKMRIGDYPSVSGLPETVSLRRLSSSTDPGVIPVPQKVLFDAVAIGERLTLNDARVELLVERVADAEILARVVRSGPLSSFKGINRPRHPLPLGQLAPADRAAIDRALEFPFTQFAFSFVHRGDESQLLRELTVDRRLIAKIERPEALSHLTAIDDGFDELWLCRGDLGAQGGLHHLGSHQRAFVNAIPSLKKPALLAGEVLHHMTWHAAPTRSEVVHLSNAIRDGFAGVVLSDETAVGHNPLAVATFLYDYLKRSGELDRSSGL